MAVKQIQSKRRRGVLLSPQGMQRIQEAISSWEITKNQGERLTLDQLSYQTNVSAKTLSRLWSANKGVDQKTLKLCFSTFNLELDEEDYIYLKEDFETKIPDCLSDSICVKTENSSLLTYPDGPLSLDSPLYIERQWIEELIYREVTQPDCVIRILAPGQMGKTSLILRLLAFADAQGYHTVNLSFSQIDASCLTHLNKFLRSFCSQIAIKLGIAPNLNDHWDEDVGYKLTCSLYLQHYILKQINHPLVLVLSEVERFFEYPQVAQEFFALLRSWCEESKHNSLWKKMRLVVAYSTENYLDLDINHSPFNIGLPIRLQEFTQHQVEELARRYGLRWTAGKESAQLISLIGGHPALTQLALYYLHSGAISLPDLIKEAIANGGIYRYHLQQHWVKLLANPALMRTYTEIVTTKENQVIDPIHAYKLESLGLITFDGDRVLPRCQLYRTYFAKQLSAIV
ncbi:MULTISPECIES: AAA-like domain-containing protein [Cyanophyceae]|uniref:AAA-like domain-containing protein n=1 Tax=Cyanophyceae TaxID=3028117 RepID=UPI00232BC3B8|nr:MULTISPECIES: AAA-like domain-containing protein [Cyanophyceae]MDB9355635.1 AAA-like domain-containing protein [Nodularia spumigena CS-587/03]MDB9304101.1 AAA-like domain-containing protein [Nodularia spumigena CS-591/12]MDB9323089.1 AAA-like domain-containing protein [Nodularia spumigena CS-591/07A]MDB9332786.1 AAA-like domain-containing protein [Nodularia spumigena CS-591/04]MDB9341549.1 AAA-like domain-containing protein [Nodularia spumigena CS-589/07]